MENKQLGLTDEYAVEDKFNVSSYVDGLTRYVARCTTPMTISVQGDWGTGKTSIMQMVKKSLETDFGGEIKTLWFNTWQYSQFDMSGNLATSMLMALTDGLGNSEEAKSVRKRIAALGGLTARLVKGVLKDATGTVVGDGLNDQIWKVISSAFTDSSTEIPDPARDVVFLKSEFQAAIDKALKNENKEKLVVFIDDLDRLKPERAVELLEVMKLFLDCKSCVFILAIDYMVVVRGVMAKYGKGFDEKKGKAFFDKIIQVPFSVPVVRYDIGSYVKNCLEEIGEADIPPEYIEKYERLIAVTVGKNPRSIKRIFNAFMLILIIAESAVNGNEDKKLLLFAILCMQNRFEAAYNAFMTDMKHIGPEMLRELRDAVDDPLLEDYMSPEYEVQELHEFFGEFYGIMQSISGTPDDEDLSRMAVRYLRDVMSLSATTSSREVPADAETSLTPDMFVSSFGDTEQLRALTDTLEYDCHDCSVTYGFDGSIKVEHNGKVMIVIFVGRDGRGQSYQLNVSDRVLKDERETERVTGEIKRLLDREGVEAFPGYIRIKRTLDAEKVRLLVEYATEHFDELFR